MSKNASVYFLQVVVFIGLMLSSTSLHAQDKQYTDDATKESSSFVPDPDPLDPLPVNNINLKEGDEIIVEDIKHVLDAKIKSPKKTEKKEIESTGKTIEDDQNKTVTAVKKSKKTVKKSKLSSKKISTGSKLINDDPDLALENKFRNQYLKFNTKPVEDAQWSQVTEGQKAQEYTVQKGDTLYSISKMLFGDSQFWPKLWAVNRGSIFNPHIIKPGLILYFYAGDENHAPVLSLDKRGSDEESKNSNLILETTEMDKMLSLDHGKKKSDPTQIPDSLPNYVNVKPKETKNEVIFEIKPIQYNDQVEIKNPYILSATDLKSEFKIAGKEVARVRCQENQYIPNMIPKDKTVEAGQYLIVLKINNKESFLRNTFVYQTVGQVNITDENKMRVQGCNYLYNTDALFVTQEALNSLSEPNEKLEANAILDGLNYHRQDYYDSNQLVVIGAQGQDTAEGQIFKIHSIDQDKTVGQLKIIKRTGNLAIGYITEVTDLIERGDVLAQ